MALSEYISNNIFESWLWNFHNVDIFMWEKRLSSAERKRLAICMMHTVVWASCFQHSCFLTSFTSIRVALSKSTSISKLDVLLELEYREKRRELNWKIQNFLSGRSQSPITFSKSPPPLPLLSSNCFLQFYKTLGNMLKNIFSIFSNFSSSLSFRSFLFSSSLKISGAQLLLIP